MYLYLYSYPTAQYLYLYSYLDHEYSHTWYKYKSCAIGYHFFLFSLTFPTTTALFKSMQLDSVLYCSVLCLCKRGKRSIHPAENVRCSSLTIDHQYQLIIYGIVVSSNKMQSCIFTLHLESLSLLSLLLHSMPLITILRDRILYKKSPTHRMTVSTHFENCTKYCV